MESQNVVECSLWLSRNIGIIAGSILVFFFLRNSIVCYSLRVVFTGLHAACVFNTWWPCIGGMTANHTHAHPLISVALKSTSEHALRHRDLVFPGFLWVPLLASEPTSCVIHGHLLSP